MKCRHVATVLFLLLAGWAAGARGPAGPLGAVSGRMASVESMLREGESGRKVQQAQQQILADLDRLVRAREQEGDSSRRRSGLRERELRTIPGGATGRPGRPAQESVLPGSRWDRGRLGPGQAPGGNWLPQLPAAERRKLDDALRTGRLPLHYRQLLRAYNRRLAETDAAGIP